MKLSWNPWSHPLGCGSTPSLPKSVKALMKRFIYLSIDKQVHGQLFLYIYINTFINKCMCFTYLNPFKYIYIYIIAHILANCIHVSLQKTKRQVRI